jgi:hypothetical protein
VPIQLFIVLFCDHENTDDTEKKKAKGFGDGFENVEERNQIS